MSNSQDRITGVARGGPAKRQWLPGRYPIIPVSGGKSRHFSPGFICFNSQVPMAQCVKTHEKPAPPLRSRTSRFALRLGLHENRANAFTPLSSGRGSPVPNAQPPGLFCRQQPRRRLHGVGRWYGSRVRPLGCRGLTSFNGLLASFRLPLLLLARAALTLSRLVFAAGPLRSAFPSVGRAVFAPVAAIKGSRQRAVMPLEAGAPCAAPDSARSTPAVTLFRSAPLSDGPAGFASRG